MTIVHDTQFINSPLSYQFAMQITIAEASVLIIVDGGVQFDGDTSFSFEHYVFSLLQK